MAYNKTKRRKQKLSQTVEHQFRLWKNQRQYKVTFEAPRELPKYRVKEFFDRTYIGTSKDTMFINEHTVHILDKDVLVKLELVGD